MALMTRERMFCAAMALRGTLDEGFQRLVLPQAAASIAFHDQTATGKLKAEMVPTIPRG